MGGSVLGWVGGWEGGREGGREGEREIEIRGWILVPAAADPGQGTRSSGAATAAVAAAVDCRLPVESLPRVGRQI